MSEPKNVLLVTNSTTDSEILLIKDAMAHAKEQKIEIKLSLVHVIPSLPTCYFSIPSMVILAERYYEEATHTLNSISESLGVAKRDQWLINGRIKTEVSRLASKLKTDFILASSTSMQDLHQSFLFSRKVNSTPIRSISSLISM